MSWSLKYVFIAMNLSHLLISPDSTRTCSFLHTDVHSGGGNKVQSLEPRSWACQEGKWTWSTCKQNGVIILPLDSAKIRLKRLLNPTEQRHLKIAVKCTRTFKKVGKKKKNLLCVFFL